MPWRVQSDAGLSSWKTTFSPRPVHVQFVGMVVVDAVVVDAVAAAAAAAAVAVAVVEVVVHVY